VTLERLLRLQPAASVKEKRLATLRAEHAAGDDLLREVVEDAQILGSLQLAGFAHAWEEIGASRRGEPAPESIRGMHKALRAVPLTVPFSTAALLAWHAAAVAGGGALRDIERSRPDGPPPCPAAFIEGRLGIAQEWLGAESASQLAPPRVGALALARIVEILPFQDGNGRVARLAASHVMVRAGARPPVLVAGDAPRLRQCLTSAFQFEMGPLSDLLEEASERALDVMIKALEGGIR
jgi:hypothetical protein